MYGPWDDTSCVWVKPTLTRQLRVFKTFEANGSLYSWQKTLLDVVVEEEDRHIHLVYDRIGNAGKSVYVEYLEYEQLAFEMPPFRQMEDIMEFANSFPPQKAYVIDMPRGMKKDKLADFYAGLETIKNGVTYDKRYCGKKRRIDRPQIIVFTNNLPVFELMTKDRWVVWVMQADRSVVKYTPDQLALMEKDAAPSPVAPVSRQPIPPVNLVRPYYDTNPSAHALDLEYVRALRSREEPTTTSAEVPAPRRIDINPDCPDCGQWSRCRPCSQALVTRERACECGRDSVGCVCGGLARSIR